MFKKSLIVGLGLSALLSGYAQAENYYGGNISFLDYSEEGIDDASLTAIVGRLGTTFNENFSGEMRLGFGVGDDTVDVSGVGVDVELDNMFGAYVRGGIPVTESFSPYAIAGFTRSKLTASVSGFGSESESESDVSFGVGADVNVSQNIIINLEYMNYYDKDGAEIAGFSIGIASKF
jgi:outer membrane immunogenic protein